MGQQSDHTTHQHTQLRARPPPPTLTAHSGTRHAAGAHGPRLPHSAFRGPHSQSATRRVTVNGGASLGSRCLGRIQRELGTVRSAASVLLPARPHKPLCRQRGPRSSPLDRLSIESKWEVGDPSGTSKQGHTVHVRGLEVKVAGLARVGATVEHVVLEGTIAWLGLANHLQV